MKTLLRTVTQLALAIAIVSIGVALVAAEEKAATKNVVVSKDSIVIPATELSKADGQAMNRILRQFDKSLYKIETYQNGELKKTRGELSDVVTDKQLASEIAENVKKKGFTQYAVQVAGQTEGASPAGTPGGGTAKNAQSPNTPPPPPPPPSRPSGSPGGGTTTNTQSPSTPTAPPPPPRAAGSPGGGSSKNPQQAQKDPEELMKRLKPILEKYSKK
jgi:hypothetical protein